MSNKGKTVRLRFRIGKHGMPIALENALAEYGFSCFGRKLGKWVIYEKELTPEPKLKETEDQMAKRLEARLKKIVDSYLDPYSHTAAIRAQCMMVADSLHEEDERLFVHDWIANNIDNEFFAPPWEDEDNFDYRILGSC